MSDLQPLVYLGTPQMAVPPLEALVDAGFPIRMVVTRPDARRRRGGDPIGSPVKLAAQKLGIPVTHDVDDVLDAGATLGVVVAFGQIIKPHVLDQLPMVNLHFSLLPRWRGAAPVERAILEGDAETGVAIMAVEEGLDTGGIFTEERVRILATTTGDQLRAELVKRGSRMLVETLTTGLPEPRPQVGEPVYAKKISSVDLRLVFSESADRNLRRIRLGRAWCEFRGERLVVWDAEVVEATGEPGLLVETDEGPLVSTSLGSLLMSEVQPAGRKRVSGRDWWNGVQPEDDERLE